MKSRFQPFFFALCLAVLPVPGYGHPTYIGDRPRDTLIFTSRSVLEDDYRKEAIDPHRYRLGTDIVVFVGDRSAHRPCCLYMCAAEEFTSHELASFLPASRRKDLPPRSDPAFARLQVTGRRAGFH